MGFTVGKYVNTWDPKGRGMWGVDVCIPMRTPDTEYHMEDPVGSHLCSVGCSMTYRHGFPRQQDFSWGISWDISWEIPWNVPRDDLIAGMLCD